MTQLADTPLADALAAEHDAFVASVAEAERVEEAKATKSAEVSLKRAQAEHSRRLDAAIEACKAYVEAREALDEAVPVLEAARRNARNRGVEVKGTIDSLGYRASRDGDEGWSYRKLLHRIQASTGGVW